MLGSADLLRQVLKQRCHFIRISGVTINEEKFFSLPACTNGIGNVMAGIGIVECHFAAFLDSQPVLNF